MEINPQVIVLPYNPTTSHIIRIEMQWTPTNIPGAALGYVLPCQAASSTDFLTGGNLIYQVENVTQGSHQFQFRFNIPCGNPPTVYGQYQLYLDDQLAQSNSFSVGGCYNGTAFPFYNFGYTPPLVSNFNFDLTRDQSCLFTPTSREIYTFNNCSTGIAWNRNTQPVNFIITSGAELVSFYDVNEQIIGDSFSGLFSEIGNFDIMQDGEYRGIENKYFVIQCEWGGIVRTDSVRITTQTGDIIVVTPDVDSIYSGHELDADININDGGGQCTIFFPFSVTYNAEIIEGNQYGGLYDYNTGQTVQSIPELFHYFGQSGFNYIGDGISADSVSRVVIRIGTSVPTVPYTDFTLYIKPPPIYAYTVPDVLGADDTADVIIKHRLEDGTLEDFPLEQTFELAVLDGCVNGNFMVNGVIDVYFADALQPIKFVTADEIDPEFDKVLIRVGTDLDGDGGGAGRPVKVGNEGEEKIVIEERSRVDTLRAGFEKMIAVKKAKAEKTDEGGNEPQAPIVLLCYPYGPNKEFNFNRNVVVGDECDDLLCQSGFNEFKGVIGIREVKQNYNDINYCDFSSIHVYPPAAGIFKPLFNEEYPNSISEKIKNQLLVDFNLELCYDKNDGYWKYRIPEDSIFLRAILDVCEDNILDGPSEFIIHDLTELSIIPNEEVCIALENFEDQRSYGSGGKYYLVEPVWAHEKVHKLNFRKLISEVLNVKMKYLGNEYRYKDLLSNVFQPECNETTNSEDKARFQIRKYLNDILSSLIVKLKDQYKRAKANEDNEVKTQNHPDVQWKISEYKKELQKNRSKEFWESCPYKEKDI